MKYARVWGHRGCRGVGNPPENSLRAFRAAIRQGASGIELDLFLSQDNHLVVFHDETLDRMTDGTGVLSSFSLSALKKLRLRDTNGAATDQTIPSLPEVFSSIDECRAEVRRSSSNSARVQEFVLNIEIKGLGIAGEVVESIQSQLGVGWRFSNFLVSSFDMATLTEVREADRRIPLGVLLEGPLANAHEPWDISEEELEQSLIAVRKINPATVNLTLPSLSDRSVQVIRAIGAEPVGWTWNEVPPNLLDKQSQLELARHVHTHEITVITDYPAQMIELLTSS